MIPEHSATACLVDRSPEIEEPRQHAGGVRFNNRNRLIEGEDGDGVRGVFSDARQLPHALGLVRKTATMSIFDDLGGGVKISRPRVVTETLPGAQDVIFRSARQSGEVGEAFEPLVIVRANGGHLSLLKHELGDKNRVGIARVTPRQIAPVVAIPTQKRAPECGMICGGDQG